LRSEAQRSVRRCFLCDRAGHLAKDYRMKWQHGTTAKSTNSASGQIEEQVISNCSSRAIHKTPARSLPLAKGLVGDNEVEVLRDTGCDGVIVKKKFVSEEQLTGEEGFMVMVDRTRTKAPIAKIQIKTPFYDGDVSAYCLDDAIHDLILGNIEGVKGPEACAVVTRSEVREERRGPKA